MSDLISRQATIDAVHRAIYPFFCGAEDGDALGDSEELVLSVNKAICTAIKALPAADVQPVRHGRWMLFDAYYCSNCHYKLQTTGIPTDCPWCGAKMDEGSEK